MTAPRNSLRARTRPWAAAVALALVPSGGALAGAYGVVARVNGVDVPAQRLEGFFEEYLAAQGRSTSGIRSPSAFKRLRRQALDLLVREELLWQEAKRKGVLAPQARVDAELEAMRAALEGPGEFERRLERGGFTLESYPAHVRRLLSIQLLLQREVFGKLEIREKEVREYYRAHAEEFVRPERVHVRHVLVQLPPGADEATRAAARRRIEEIRALAEGGADFAELARTRSEDSSAAAGGDLGFVSRGQVVGPFEEAAFALRPGELSGVVETPFGFHLIHCEERRGGGRISREDAREPIRRRLLAEKARRALEEKVQALRAEGTVELDPSLDP